MLLQRFLLLIFFHWSISFYIYIEKYIKISLQLFILNYFSWYPFIGNQHCVKNVQIRSFFWSVFSCIRTEYEPEKTPYLDTFHAVSCNQCKCGCTQNTWLDYSLENELYFPRQLFRLINVKDWTNPLWF